MTRFIAALLLLALAVPAAADTFSKGTISFGGRERSFYLDIPDSAVDPAPLVVLLHGSGGEGFFMLQCWKEEARREGIVLLAPNALHPEKGWDLHDDGPDFIHEAIKAAAARHPIDFHRLYVFGQSGGAVYALSLAMLESEYFAAVAFHAGGWRRQAEERVMEYAKRRIPIALYVGDKDEYFSLASVRNTERVLKSAGFPATLTVLEGRRHSYLDVPDDFHDTVWSFLKTNALTDLPTFVPYRLTSSIDP